MTQAQQPKDQSQMDTLLANLQEQVDRYEKSLANIRESRLTIQLDSEHPEQEKNGAMCRGSLFNDGILNRLENLIIRFTVLNDGAGEEVRVLRSYL